MSNPRFRTIHEAGKYLSAQAYPAGRFLEPQDYGAVPRYIENPAWTYAPYEAVVNADPRASFIIDHNEDKVEVKTSEEWYKEDSLPAILFADGWPGDDDEFNYAWREEKITLAEFNRRRAKSVCFV